MEKTPEIELSDNSTTTNNSIERRSSNFNSSELIISAEKQLTRMNFIAEVLSKAKKVNKNNEKNEIVNIDDILVEMAILQMKKMTDVWVFYIRVSYRGKKWTVRKTFPQIKELHNSFSFKPTTRLPNFQQSDQRMYLRVAKYLVNINNEIKTAKDRQKFNLFLEAVYNLKEENKMGEVIKSGWAKKKTGGRYKGNKVWNYIKTNFDCCWRHRFFVLTEEGIGYTNRVGDDDFRDVLMFDHTLRVRVGIHYTHEKRGIVLYTSSRRLKIKVKNHFELIDWLEAIIDSISKSPYCKKNRFSSFSPLRSRNWAKWYINGHDYYRDLAYDLEKAKDEIYITDWWMSPEVYLIRPIKTKIVTGEDGVNREELDTYWRLDQILKRRAEAGVKIFILLYREFEQALPNKSAYTQATLMNLLQENQNIEVMRHPGNLIFLWSHHEKTVTIDQKICYMGGLDLCYGRYDQDNYPLSDPGNDENGIYFPGQDYSNVRIKDFVNVDNFNQCLIDKNSQPRMPWRDVAIKLKGLITKDITRHFIQYWNFAKIDIEGKNRKNFLQKKFFKKKVPKKKRALTGTLSNVHELLMKKKKFKKSEKEDNEEDNDINEPLMIEPEKTQREKSQRKSGLFKKKKNSVMPKEMSTGTKKLFKGLKKKKDSQKRKGGRGNNFEDFLKKIGANKKKDDENEKKLTVVTGTTLPQTEETEESEEEGKKSQKKGAFSQMFQATTILSSLSSQKLMRKSRNSFSFSDFTCDCQILRSAGHWSIGLRTNQTERSIQNAYIDLISNAEHFIYIENQFFVSSVSGNPVKNQIAEAIIKRIELAIEKEQDFKVCVFIPLLPGFEGGIDEKSGNVMRIQLGWEYHTINRGKKSILQRIAKKTDNPSKYIRFFGLRNHGVMNDGTPATEIVYIHSKCLIIDDRIALIGSANINDRSMVGSRDSELAVVVEDKLEIDSIMGGKNYSVRKFAHKLRMRCFSGIFGFNKNEDFVRDPLDTVMWSEIDRRVNTNTEIYRTVFGVYPDDTVFTVKGVQELKEKADISKYEELKGKIKGVGVDFPLKFLKNENLKKMKHFEFGLYLLPNHIFT